MSTESTKYLAAVALVSLLAACSQYPIDHKVMRGSVVRMNYDMVIVCLGSRDGLERGMQLDVYTTIFEGSVEDGTDNYRKKPVGEIEVHAVINEHYSRARILKGDVRMNDVVELPQK